MNAVPSDSERLARMAGEVTALQAIGEAWPLEQRAVLDNLKDDVTAKARAWALELADLPESGQLSLLNRLREQAGITQLHLIGDAYAPGMIAQAVFSGHRLAREIDSPNPDEHLPFIRERRLVGATEDDYVLDAATLRP